jgi:hypothetical protein
MGMADFKLALANCAANNLPEIYRELRARALKFGEQTDDQTMLLIRFVPPSKNHPSAPSL